MLPGSMSRIQHDDEDFHEDIFNNEASGMEELEIKDFYTTTTDLYTTGKSNLFENQSTIRPVFKQQSTTTTTTEASSIQKHDHQPRDEQQQMSTILIASIIVSCFVITALSVALVVYIAFRYRRRRAQYYFVHYFLIIFYHHAACHFSIIIDQKTFQIYILNACDTSCCD
ncbi:hypothetical protein T4E_4812 [Trichinella pseudospiralis]|uniref:Uncharacterized protein n=1 Tax=Trichinella pseudospiralis TaxID=6337 RepID=A0A0V0Y7J0_TRIPS|nr:hypothetical protein T4E_4812 [Trichinella pseudospiralis]